MKRKPRSRGTPGTYCLPTDRQIVAIRSTLIVGIQSETWHVAAAASSCGVSPPGSGSAVSPQKSDCGVSPQGSVYRVSPQETAVPLAYRRKKANDCSSRCSKTRFARRQTRRRELRRGIIAGVAVSHPTLEGRRLVFQVKICGVRTQADVEACVAAGADAVGINFHPPSSRFVDRREAAAISQSAEGRLQTVGVFVNRDPQDINQIAASLGLDYVQLHGDEPPEICEQLEVPQIIRAVRLRPGADLAAYTESWQSPQLAGFLVDAWKPGEFGGTGEVVDWGSVARSDRGHLRLPLVLAGGLTASNVADAIQSVKPEAVDTASGVEDSPGVKSPTLIQAFVSEARRAFASSGLGRSESCS